MMMMKEAYTDQELMEKSLQYRYTKLCHLQPGTKANFYGLVTDFKPPFKSSGTDYCVVVSIIDETLPRLHQDGKSGDSHSAIPIKLFMRDPQRLPQMIRNKAVVQFRHFRIKLWNNRLEGVSNHGESRWIIFSRDGTGQWTADPSHELSQHEIGIVEEIFQGCNSEPGTITTTTTVMARPDRPEYESQDPMHRIRQLSDLGPDMAFDLIAQVIGIPMCKTSQTTCLYLTDYTENDLLKVDRVDIARHMSKRILFVTFYDQYASFAATLQSDHIVLIRNLWSKLLDGKLVAVMRGRISGAISDNIILLDSQGQEACNLQRRKEYLDQMAENIRQAGSFDITMIRVEHSHLPIVNCLTLLSCPPEPKVYVVMARAMSIIPTNMWHIVKDGKFMFELLLEDDSGAQVPVIVGDSDAQVLLGCHPTDYGSEQHRRLGHLLGSLIHSPFLIKTYLSKSNVRRYFLSETVIMC